MIFIAIAVVSCEKEETIIPRDMTQSLIGTKWVYEEPKDDTNPYITQHKNTLVFIDNNTYQLILERYHPYSDYRDSYTTIPETYEYDYPYITLYRKWKDNGEIYDKELVQKVTINDNKQIELSKILDYYAGAGIYTLVQPITQVGG